MARLFTPSESKYYLMALDAGTGSIRAVIFDLEGNQIAVGQAEWRHLAVPDVPGSMEFDLNKNWQLACECMRQALHNAGIAPEYIAAVSACSMREGIVLYNNEGAPIWACANVDARAAREVSELKELHNNTFENEVYRATGQTLALSAIPRLLWLAHHRSDIYRQASTITMISDWLAYMLSGELAVDPSNAGTTGLLDLTTRDWKPALLDMAGLRADILSCQRNRHIAGRGKFTSGGTLRSEGGHSGGRWRRRRAAWLPWVRRCASGTNRGSWRHILAASCKFRRAGDRPRNERAR